MGQMTRYCHECGQDQLLRQPHEDSCPDLPGGCPEWACTGCGAAWITGIPGPATAGLSAPGLVA
jgi:hypothetical protein